jgi:hypothetical protein
MDLLRRLSKSGLNHYFAGVLLLVFAISHFAASLINIPSQESINVVFPFLTNKTLYLIVGVFEFCIAIICLINHGRDRANAAIFAFVIVMLWYRWAFHFSGGGKSCGCIGALGLALHLTQVQEKVIPIIVLVLFSLMILPWLLRCLSARSRLWFKRFSAKRLTVTTILIFICHSSYGGKTTEVQGSYDTYDFNPQTGARFTNQTVHATFDCKFSGVEWSIFATNSADNETNYGSRTPWEGLIYDGTNTYTLVPDFELAKTNYPMRSTISPGEQFLRDYDENLNFHVLWMTYGAHPSNISTNKNGIIDIPLPWMTARIHPGAFGFEWKITPSADGRFISECQVFRNTNVDLAVGDEMRRPGIDPPYTLPLRNRFTELLNLRSRLKPQGFHEVAYKCNDWFVTNGLSIPASSEFLRYHNRTFSQIPACRASVKASTITSHEGFEHLVPPILQKTFVADYRYNRIQGDRIVPRIEYVLNPGDLWKPDNAPELQKKLTQSIYDVIPLDRSNTGIRNYLTWFLLVIGLGPAVILFMTKTKQQPIK